MRIKQLQVSFVGEVVYLSIGCPIIAEKLQHIYGQHCQQMNLCTSPDISLEVYDSAGGADYVVVERSLDEGVFSDAFFNEMAALSHLRERIQYRLIASHDEHLMIHGAAAVKDGQCDIFPAGSGSGKTTLSAWLIGQGYELLSDELIAIDQYGRAAGFAQALHVKPASVGVLENWPWITEPLEYAYEMPVGGKLVCWHNSQYGVWVPIRRILIPVFNASADPVAEPLSPGQAIAALVEALLNIRNFSDRGLPRVSELASHMPAFRLHYGSSDACAKCFEQAS